MFGYIFLIVVLAILVFGIKSYNALRRGSERVKRANSDMQGELRKRATLVNQLIEVCKGFGDHEKLTHITVANQTSSLAESAVMARSTNTVIERVAAFAANFPDLKADQTYVKLMGQIQGIEDVLQDKREAYNRCVEDYNTHRASFPTVFFSQQLGFPEAPYFKTDEAGLDETAEFKTDDGALLRAQMTRLGDAAGQAGRKLVHQTARAVDQIRERTEQPAALVGHAEAPETNVVPLHEVIGTTAGPEEKKPRRRTKSASGAKPDAPTPASETVAPEGAVPEAIQQAE